MKETLHKIWSYLLDAGLETLIQLIILLGPIIMLAVIMNFVAMKNEKLSYKVLGQKIYLYVFGWLGTSVHELGHAIFALLFAHKISEIKLFTPSSGKSLGHVKHSYTRGNPYQTLGNFFIGLGPILLGSLLLFVVTWFLFGLNIFSVAEKHDIAFSPPLFSTFDSVVNIAIKIGKGVWDCLETVISNPGKYGWKLALFFYLFYAIGSAVRLSGSDIKGAFNGFLYFLILLFLFNIATLWHGDFISTFFEKISNQLSGFYFLIILSMGLNLLFILILFLVSLIMLPFIGKTSKGKPKK